VSKTVRTSLDKTFECVSRVEARRSIGRLRAVCRCVDRDYGRFLFDLNICIDIDVFSDFDLRIDLYFIINIFISSLAN
jgi:hypothetical protein